MHGQKIFIKLTLEAQNISKKKKKKKKKSISQSAASWQYNRFLARSFLKRCTYFIKISKTEE